MYNVYHRFCGVLVETAAPRPMKEDGQAAVFRTEAGLPELTVSLEPVPELPRPDGVPCGSAGGRSSFRSGQRIVRVTKDRFRPVPHSSVSYNLDDPGAVKAFVRQEDWDWATDTRYLWSGLCLNQLLLHFRTLLFHASYVDVGGRGLLFTAPSGVGKSTQAELWRKYRGAEVINGDKAAVNLEAAPVLHSVPFAGTSGICLSRTLPLEAVVVLSQAPVNSVQPMAPSAAVAALCPNVFVDQTVPEEWSLALNLILDLTASVPIYSLACTPDVRAVEALETALNKKYTTNSGNNLL